MKQIFNKKSDGKNRGFLLVELIVALFIFSLVMTISIGSIVNLLDANRKTQSLKSVMNNLNLVLDTMTKAIAVGSKYHCGPAGAPDNCPVGDTQMTFESNEDIDGDGNFDDKVTYALNTDIPGKYYIERILDSEISTRTRMTAPEIDITGLTFVVSGAIPYQGGSDLEQPKVIILVEGTTKPTPRNTQSPFHIQTVVTQRLPDNL